jgi:Flp pilus assembly protein TadB
LLPLVGGAAAAVLALALLGWPVGAATAIAVAPASTWCVRAARRRPSVVVPDAATALALDLAGAALRAGLTVPDALGLAVPVAASVGPQFDRVGVLLRLGADPVEAWAAVAEGPLASVARTAVRSSSSGVRLAAALERQAVAIRAELSTAARVRAERTGVLALAPLGLCFLPAFVCLGVVPVVVGIAEGLTSVIP